MSDYREKIYQTYVSDFKESSCCLSQKQLANLYTYYDLKYLPLFPEGFQSKEILEIGCGSGLFLDYLKRSGCKHLLGIDRSPEQVDIAKQKNLEIQNIDVFTFLKDKKNAFDVIVAFDLIEHFSKGECLELMQLIWESLKDSGCLIIQTPNGEGLFPGQVIYGDYSHLNIFSASSLENILRVSKFKEIKFFETGPVKKGFTGCLRFFLWGFIKWAANAIRIIETGKKTLFWTENIICLARK